MPELLLMVKGYDENKKLKTTDLVFSDSKTLNSQATQFDGGALFTLFIILFFITCVVVCSFIQWKRQRDALRLEEERNKLQGGANVAKPSKKSKRDGVRSKDSSSSSSDKDLPVRKVKKLSF